jgi:DNA modification methylase
MQELKQKAWEREDGTVGGATPPMESPAQQQPSVEPYTTPRKLLSIGSARLCSCPENHLSCISPKEWLKAQVGVWRFAYEKRDIRDKRVHPATFPIALAKRVIELFTHVGELVLDPFVGTGTTLVAAQDLDRNAVGFDLQERYIAVAQRRLAQTSVFGQSQQIAICDDARNIPDYLAAGTVKLIFTSPPYANLLNRPRLNKSRRSDERRNEQFLKVEQYSQDPRDLGTLPLEPYVQEMARIFAALLPLLRPDGQCVVNIPDMWWEDRRIPLHIALVEALCSVGYELRNIIIWDRTNIVNRVGIFGYPSNFIVMGTTFEYLLHFWRASQRDGRQ